ncbi:MAG TPA: 50S ribosomal protein L23 [Candidatus Paceibacterota bacterium]
MINQFIIKKPIVTEKSASLGNLGQYVFMVEKNASSAEIKKMVKSVYHVNPVRVNIINVKPRFGRYGRIKTETRSAYKKAIVTIKKGQTIDILPH